MITHCSSQFSLQLRPRPHIHVSGSDDAVDVAAREAVVGEDGREVGVRKRRVEEQAAVVPAREDTAQNGDEFVLHVQQFELPLEAGQVAQTEVGGEDGAGRAGVLEGREKVGERRGVVRPVKQQLGGVEERFGGPGGGGQIVLGRGAGVARRLVRVGFPQQFQARDQFLDGDGGQTAVEGEVAGAEEVMEGLEEGAGGGQEGGEDTGG